MKNLMTLFSLLFFATLACVFSIPSIALAKLNVVTTTADIAYITREVGGDDVQVDAIAKGTQDPHAIEAKPSFMVKISHADLVIANGLELEIGWLPSLLQGARNPNVKEGSRGYLEVGHLVNIIEIPDGKVTRADGDVHPSGNPHVTLSPINAGLIAVKIAEKLSELETSKKTIFTERAQKFKSRLDEKTKIWKTRIDKTGIKSVITYHKTLNYFLNTFGIKNSITLEPKPGIPPTSRHILDVINIVKNEKIKLIMIENFYDSKVAERVKEESPSVRIVSVPASTEGEPGINRIEDLYEKLVQTFEGK